LEGEEGEEDLFHLQGKGWKRRREK
jgi:hypothetical protein